MGSNTCHYPHIKQEACLFIVQVCLVGLLCQGYVRFIAFIVEFAKWYSGHDRRRRLQNDVSVLVKFM